MTVVLQKVVVNLEVFAHAIWPPIRCAPSSPSRWYVGMQLARQGYATVGNSRRQVCFTTEHHKRVLASFGATGALHVCFFASQGPSRRVCAPCSAGRQWNRPRRHFSTGFEKVQLYACCSTGNHLPHDCPNRGVAADVEASLDIPSVQKESKIEPGELQRHPPHSSDVQGCRTCCRAAIQVLPRTNYSVWPQSVCLHFRQGHA